MKINGEARLLLVMGLAVLLGGGAMILVNKTPAIMPAPPTPSPRAQWSTADFDALLKQARHVRGDVKAPKITVVEFGDFECPSCRHAYNTLMVKLDSGYPGIKFVFQNLPLDMHPQAMPAAIRVESAGLQGKYWPMFDAIYTGEKTPLNTDFYDACAKKIGLDMNRFKTDNESTTVAATVMNDQKLALQLQIRETPSFVVRDESTGKIQEVTGANNLDTLLSTISRRPKLLPPATK